MFTGIILGMGHVMSIDNKESGLSLAIQVGSLAQCLKVGDSVAINGICLTVVKLDDQVAFFDVSSETCGCTTINHWQVNQAVNLEPALTLKTPLGGHLVTGHIDQVVQVLDIVEDGNSYKFQFKLPRSLAPFVAAKGSIAIDGVSLTVNWVKEGAFGVTIIPHTFEVTHFGQIKTGSFVNLEVDLMARYAQRLHQLSS